jgi:hypothetical protein
MNNTTQFTTLQFRLDNLQATSQANNRLLRNKLAEITKLLQQIIGTPNQAIESVVRLRETGTSTPPILTREQSTQSPISSKGSHINAQNVFDCPIIARQLNGSESPTRSDNDPNGPANY